MTNIDVDEALRDLECGRLPEWIATHLRNYLESGGNSGHLWDSSGAGGPGLLPTLILSTTGRRSGKANLSPLIYAEIDDCFIVVASKGGAPSHPAWYLNLTASPRC